MSFHTLPALEDAAVALPGISFDWVVEAFAEIPARHRAVDRVIPVALRRWRKTRSGTLPAPSGAMPRRRCGSGVTMRLSTPQGC